MNKNSANHIIELSVTNYMGAKAVWFRPAKNGVVIIGGNNGHGKSSVLNAILSALCGKSYMADVPVTIGQESSEVILKIDTDPPLIVEQTITADGTRSLKLYYEMPGAKPDKPIKSNVAKPQSVLDSLVGKVAFDPLAFTRLKPAEQVKLLAELVGVDTAKIDGTISALMQERAEINKEVAKATARLAGMVRHDDVPNAPIDSAELIAELRKAQDHNAAVQKLATDADAVASTHKLALTTVENLRQQLAAAEASAASLAAQVTSSRVRADEAAGTVIDVAAIEQRIAMTSDVNRKVGENQQRVRVAQELENHEAEADSLKERLEESRQQRLSMMGAAKWPVDGLGFGSDGVTFDKLPFHQCSSAEQLRISTAIGVSQHPTLKVMMIRDGSLLDDHSLEIIHKLAVQHDAQVLIERVGRDDPGAIIIEDGEYQPDKKLVASQT